MSESFLNGRVVLHAGDSREVLKTLADNSIDSIVTDPPYALVSIVKRFGGNNAAAVKVPEGGSGAYARASSGFMGKQWDTGETAFAVEFWAECLRVLKPGGHVVAFSGTRTYHRMACAIEDAGFEIRDQLQWVYGSGFPKSHDVSKGIDRAAGAEREVIGSRVSQGGRSGGNNGFSVVLNQDKQIAITQAATASALQWQGWGTALKPACEPICFGRKPLSEKTVAANVLAHGVGAINIGACRVEGEKPLRENTNGREGMFGMGSRLAVGTTTLGRWPANLLHDGSDEVLAGFPETTSGLFKGERSSDKFRSTYGAFKGTAAGETETYGDTGSAARFFYQAEKDDRCDLCSANIAASRSSTKNTQTESFAAYGAAVSHQPGSSATVHQSNGHATSAASHSPQCHQPKADSAPKSAPDSLPSKIVRNVLSAANLCASCATAIAQEIVAASRKEPLGSSLSAVSIGAFKKTILLQCLASYVESRESTDTILTTTNLRELFGCVFHAIGESIRLARVGSEASTEPAPKRLWYSSKADADDRLGSKHPTVKPVDLMQWLCRLVTPLGGTVLDPFAGTGTTGEAAFREGFNAVLIEREAEYQADIRRRMGLVLSGPDERSRESIKARLGDAAPDHGPLFGGLDPIAEAAE